MLEGHTQLIFQQQQINLPNDDHRFFLQHLQQHQGTLENS